MAEYNPSKIIKDGNTYNFRDNTKIPLAGSNQISGDLIPSTDGTVNLGSPSYQWNNAYIKSLTINGVACGDILTHNVSEFVNVTGTQTIVGVKTFSSEVTMFGRDINLMSRVHYGKNSNPSVSTWQYLYFRGNTATEGYTNAWYGGYIEQYIDTTGLARGRWLIRDTSENAVSIELYVDGNNKQVRPIQNSAVDLGSSTNKWKSINGINPGALSLPSNSYVNVDTTNWDVAGGTNFYTPPTNGWIHIRVVGATELMVRWTGWGFGDRRVSATATDLGVTIPVVAGVTVDVVTVASGFNGKCQFFPCQGNV